MKHEVDIIMFKEYDKILKFKFKWRTNMFVDLSLNNAIFHPTFVMDCWDIFSSEEHENVSGKQWFNEDYKRKLLNNKKPTIALKCFCLFIHKPRKLNNRYRELGNELAERIRNEA